MMIFFRVRTARTAAIILVLNALYLLAVWLRPEWLWSTDQTGDSKYMNLLIWGIRGFVVIAFLVLGWREMLLLFQRPAKNMGAGWKRVWAVGRTTVFEAWASRVWLLPVLWLAAAMLLILAVRPFDESERIPLYIRMLLSSQEILLMVMMWVMACISLPRERERKVVITNASKPLSRLEIVLGKIVGFSVVSALLLVFMGVASLVILNVSDVRLRSRALEAYDIQKKDFSAAIGRRDAKITIQPPNEGLRQLSEEGSLYAYNYITVPKENMSILGLFDASQNPPERWIKGGSNEKITYRFTPRLIAPPDVFFRPVGTRPFFEFYFPRYQFPGQTVADTRDIEINVTAYCSQSHRVPPPKPQGKTLKLKANGVARWEPDSPEDLYTVVDPQTLIPLENSDQGEVTVEVTCSTPGVLLKVIEGVDPDPVTGMYPAGADFNVFFNPEPKARISLPPMSHPIVRGFERRERQEISGPKAGENFVEYAIYRFPGKSLQNVPVDEKKNFFLSVQFESYKSDNADQPTTANIDVFSADNPTEVFHIQNQEILEKRNMRLLVPDTYLGNPNSAKRGDMFVRVNTYDVGHSISLIEDSVRIELPRSFFFVNLFQSELVILLEAVLLITIAVTCSIRVGWPIAMFCSVICLFFGYFVEFIAGLQVYGGLGALNYHPTGDNQTMYNFLDNAAGILWKVLGFISAVVPNFTVYRPTDFISTLQHMPWSIVGDNLLNTVTFVIPIIGLAYLMFRKQELG